MADFAENVTAVMLVDKNKRVSLHWASTKKFKHIFLLIERRRRYVTSPW